MSAPPRPSGPVPTPAPSAGAPSGGVPSPCVNICRMNEASGLCEGCQRTLDEIAFWSVLDDDDKRAVWQLVQQRREAGPVGSPAPANGAGPGAP